MSDGFPIVDAFTRSYRTWRYRLRYRGQRWKRAWSYARDHLSTDDAQQVLIDCEYAAGWFPLLTLTVEDTLEQALEVYEDHPTLRDFIAEGCARVGKKWEDHSDTLYYARGWAIDCALEYAGNEGIEFVPRNPDESIDANTEDHGAVP
jgi:hypothetical protein